MTDQEPQKHANIVTDTVIGSCLRPLLKALKWQGSKRRLKEVLPHFSNIYSVQMLCEIMQNLNYEYSCVNETLGHIDPRVMPCLFVNEVGKFYVVISETKKGYKVFDGEAGKQRELALDTLSDHAKKGKLYAFKFKKQKEKEKALEASWGRRTYHQNKKLVHYIILTSFVLNILALSTPLFIMSVYNRVIRTGSYYMLWQFSIGIGIAMTGIILLYRVRGNMLAVLSSRLDKSIGNHIFERLLFLAPSYTENASVGSQVARIRDFDRLREFLSGSMMATFFDTPFIFIAIVIIGILGGNLILVPIILILAFILSGVFFYPRIKRRVSRNSFHHAQYQEFLLETTEELRAIKYLGAEGVWKNRFKELSANNSMMALRLSIINTLTVSLSDAFMIMAGMGIISFGALKVIDGDLSVGAMIAIMMIIWRILAPLKTIFNTLPRLQQMTNSLRQMSMLMKIQPESQMNQLVYANKQILTGPITFNRVSFRYQTTHEPALLGVDFTVNKGELVGIVGRNGVGKSTILKLVLGMYQPQSGTVRIDNQDIRQINPIMLRSSIGYLPQTLELFYGSIAANLKLAKADATDEELREAADRAGILQDIESLPQGFDTSLRDHSAEKLSSSFQELLCLARVYLKKPSIMLLDEPGASIDAGDDKILMNSIASMRGKVTLLMISHRPSHLKLMDKILVLDQGQLVAYGKASEVLEKIPKDML